ncbi:MAG: hypothetical protein JKY52_08380 [Flavobacteriales bacterium]|nr:hypothetical protein [Flavobacteriales bacterium]
MSDFTTWAQKATRDIIKSVNKFDTRLVASQRKHIHAVRISISKKKLSELNGTRSIAAELDLQSWNELGRKI